MPLSLTPRTNPTLTQKLAEFDSLAEGLDYAARGVTGFNFYSARGQLVEAMSYRNFARAGRCRRRAGLLGLGLKRGDRVAVVAETGPEFMEVFFGCQYAGLVPCPVPYSMHIGGKDAYVDAHRRHAARRQGARRDRCRTISPRMSAMRRRAPASVDRRELSTSCGPQPDLDRRSSGRSGPTRPPISSIPRARLRSPKGVLVTQRAIIANTRGILRDGLKVVPNDRAFSWLPLYHDMGLVGFCLAPMMGQVTVDYLATTAFARRPALWLKLMSENRSTIAYSPSFGYELGGAPHQWRSADARSCPTWRVAGIGGDMVRADILDLFAEKLSVAGFEPQGLPAELRHGRIDAWRSPSPMSTSRCGSIASIASSTSCRAAPCRPARRRERKAGMRRFVVCGRPLPGHEAVIRDESGEALGEREIGRILVKGPSVMAGLFRQ